MLRPSSAHPARAPRVSRDRHGRGMRGPLAWPPVPAIRSRSDTFDELVLDAVDRIERRLPRGLGNIELAVELVPPSDPAPWEPQQVPLSRLFPSDRGLPTRIVIYRRPVESRIEDPRDLALVINDIVVEQLAAALDVDPTDLDPSYNDRG